MDGVLAKLAFVTRSLDVQSWTEAAQRGARTKQFCTAIAVDHKAIAPAA